jgi:hypothetical protein
MNSKIWWIMAVLICFALVQPGWSQWSSDPSQNLPLANNNDGADQVQPKVKPLPNGQWYVSWFDADPNDQPPIGYDVYLQRLDVNGYEQLPHGGILVADLSNSSTEDYGLDIDMNGNALLAFLDTREGSAQQVTAAKMDKNGNALWGPMGVQLTNVRNEKNHSPRVTGTSDGNVVVAWTSKNVVMVQKLDQNGNPLWPKPFIFREPGYNYILADLHAADNGGVIVSWSRDNGFFSNHQLRANKLSATGKRLWGNNVVIFDQGSLQFGEFPYFVPDGSGGAVFSWYTNSPTLQAFAQHIRADGGEAFPHNGVPGTTDPNRVSVEPSVSYRAATGETFLFWTEEDALQTMNGVYGQNFDSQGNPQWTSTGLALVPLGNDQQSFVENVQVGDGTVLVFWVDSPGYGLGTLQAAKLNPKGYVACKPFLVSSAPSNKFRLSADVTSAKLAAVAWTDDRIGNNAIYIQDVRPNCSLGQK